MKDKVVFLIFVIAFYSAPSIFAQDLTGVYIQDDMENIKLYLSEDLFLFEDEAKYEHSAPFNCKDTLAFGYWELDDSKTFLKLYTNPMQYSSLIRVNVEENVGESLDSMYLYIQNPVEVDYAKYNERSESKGLVYYRINIETSNAKLDYKVNTKTYNLNKIVFEAPREGSIRNIEIGIYPKSYSVGWRSNMPPYFVTTLPYEPLNPKANIFKISIPELTECYLCSLRLNGDFVKLLNDQQLEWDGHIYTKEK